MKLDDHLKADADRNGVRWIKNACWLVAGVIIGILLCQAIG